MNDFEATAAVRPIPWAEFRAELLALYNPPLRTPATYREMVRVFNLVGTLDVETTAGLDVSLIARLVASRPAAGSSNTTLKHLRGIRAMANYAVRSGYLRISPFAIRPVSSWARKSPPKGKRRLSREEIRRILDVLAADVEAGKGWRGWKARRLQALVCVYGYCGLRAAEGQRLHVEDLDIPGRIIHVRPREDHRLKTETSAAPVPMPLALVPILTDWLGHRLDGPPGFALPASVPWLFPNCRRRGPWVQGTPGQKPLDAFQAVARRAGVEGATFQALRRSLATHLRYFGVGSGLASTVLRHSVEVDEEFYNGPDLDNLRDAVKDVEF